VVVPDQGLCGGLLSPVCGVVGSAGESAANLVLDAIGSAFVSAAQSVSDIALQALDATTQIDLTASWFTRNVGVIAAITLPAVVGLFVLQVIGSVVRREPGGLGRAVLGVGKAMLGAVLAITQLALLATDQICTVIAASAGTSVKEVRSSPTARKQPSSGMDLDRRDSAGKEALHGLAGEFSDEVEVLVEMENGAVIQLGRGGDQQIGDRRGAMLSALSQEPLHLYGPVLDRGGQVLHRHRRQWR
jgi:hypothetical protein